MNYSQTTERSNPAVRWLALAGWVLIALAYLTFFTLDLQLDYAQLLVPCEGADCNYTAISQAEFDVLESWGLSSQTYSLILNGATVLGVTACWLLGLLILWRQGHTQIGWTVSLVLAILPITMISDVDNVAIHYPGLLIPTSILSNIGTLVLFGVLYLFPNGHFYPRWAFIPYALSFLMFTRVDRFFSGGIPSTSSFEPILVAIVIGAVIFPGILQIFRYIRISNATERQQTKWILFGLLLIIVNFPLWFLFFGGIVEIAPGQPRLLVSLGGWLTNILLITSLPVSMAIAISRYRLWDIDLVVRRTLQYGLLTGLLAFIYYGSVITLQAVVRGLTGQGSSPIITVLTTLAIAALFNPLRYRIQDFIDRRFYRKKYNAELALAQFAATARDEVDMEKLSSALFKVVEDTMQPEHASLWLRREQKITRNPTNKI